MAKYWLLLFVVLFHPSPASAVELSIADPLVTGLEITVEASLSATTNYYLQGVIRAESSSKYFGETQNSKGGWIDYLSSPEKEYIASNFLFTDVQNATWSGMVKLRFKLDDPNYLGPGAYDLKLRRFTGGSTSSAGDSNTLRINLTQALPTPTPSPSPSPSISPSPSPKPSPSLAPPSALVSPRPSLLPTPIASMAPTSVGTIAGAMTEIDLSIFGVSPSPSPLPRADLRGVSSQVPKLNQVRLKTAIALVSGLSLLSLATYLGYRHYLSVYNQTV